MESPLHQAPFRLIETMLWDGQRLVRRDRHLARLKASAAALGFRHEAGHVQETLAAIGGDRPLRVRLTAGPDGGCDVTAAALPPARPVWLIAVASDRLESSDPFLRHKTTQRALYDQARATLPEGMDEMIFLNERGEACEGAITTLFFDRGDGLRTPPVTCGCLPGVLRAEMLDTGRAREEMLFADDLPQVRLWVGNSLRGLIPATLAP